MGTEWELPAGSSVTTSWLPSCCSHGIMARHSTAQKDRLDVQHSTHLSMHRFATMQITKSLMHNSLLIRIIATPKGKILCLLQGFRPCFLL